MTEEEAKTKWCPFSRPAQVAPEHCGVIRGNREMKGEPDDGALCIASACMAWSADSPKMEGSYGAKKPEGEGWELTQAGWERLIEKRHSGHYGLATFRGW